MMKMDFENTWHIGILTRNIYTFDYTNRNFIYEVNSKLSFDIMCSFFCLTRGFRNAY